MIMEGLRENTEILPSFNLNNKQLEAVRYFDGPLLILAGAGTGKTKTLTSKIALLIASGLPADNILAITFTNKAAQEMQNRVGKLINYDGRMWIHTFHALGARLLRQYGQYIGIPKDFVIYDDDDQKKLLALCLQELRFETDKDKIPLFLSLISRAKDDLLDAESYEINANAANDAMRIKLAAIYKKYEQKLREAGALDFGDLILRTADLLKNSEEVKNRLQNKFKYVFIDEYQDTNRAQYILVKTICEKHKNLCVVGDPDQSVYGWRGADIRNIMEFEKDFKDAKTIILDQNYRSTSLILEAANEVIKHNVNRKPKDLWTASDNGTPPVSLEFSDESEEALGVATRINHLTSNCGCNYNDVSVFYRTNAQSRSFEEAFRRARIPYKIIGSVRFYDRKEIKDALSYLKVLVMPTDTVSLLRTINLPARGIGKTAIEKLRDFAVEKGIGLYETLSKADEIQGLTTAAKNGIKQYLSLFEDIKSDLFSNTPTAMLEQILIKSGYWKMTEDLVAKEPEEAQNRLGNLQELVNAVKEFEENAAKNGTPATLAKYLEEVMLSSGIDQLDSNAEAVTIMTVHLAKGLEFPIVFLTGMEEDLFPISSRNCSEDEMEEERRLAYVGMTRAKKILVLTWAATRRVFGNTYEHLQSRFIHESRIETKTVPTQNRYAGRQRNNNYSSPQNSYYSKSNSYSAPEARKPSTESAAKENGKRVIHPTFGPGTIIEQLGSGEYAKATVKFDNGLRQTFMLKYAPLKPM